MSVATIAPPLTEKGEAILDFIGSFWLRLGYSPSMADIAKGVGLSSRSTVQYHLRNLARDGWLVPAEPNTPRATALSPQGWERIGLGQPAPPAEVDRPDLATAKEQGWSFFERLLLFCDTYTRTHQRSPGFRDVADAFDVTLSTAAAHIRRARWGGLLVEPEPNTPRGISLTPGGRKRLDQSPLRPSRP